MSRCLFVDTIGRGGGAERSMAELLVALRKRGADVSAALPEGCVFDLLSDAGVPVSSIPVVRLHRPSLNCHGRQIGLAALFRARNSLSCVISREKPKIVIANSFAALLVAANCGCKVFWHVRDIPSWWQIRIGLSLAARFVAISEYVFNVLVEQIPASDRNRVMFIENGIDLSRFYGRKLHIANSLPRVGMIANFVPWKRHDIFIAAATEFIRSGHDAKFLMAGVDLFNEHGNYVSGLKRMVATAGVGDRIEFLGNVDTEKLLPTLDLLVHPAGCEPFGRVVCEAMAASVPVISNRSGGPSSIITDGKTGWLVDGDSPSFYAEKILTALSDTHLYGEMAINAKAEVARKFDIERVASDFLRFMNK